VVMAVTDKEKGTRGGISGFVVEKGTPGFRPGKKENKLGLRASDTAERQRCIGLSTAARRRWSYVAKLVCGGRTCGFR